MASSRTRPRARTASADTTSPGGRRSRSRAGTPPVPLGSLTQRDSHRSGACRECGSTRITRLSIALTDGTPVDFTSCHRCEHRTWEQSGAQMSVESVLDRSRKIEPRL